MIGHDYGKFHDYWSCRFGINPGTKNDQKEIIIIIIIIINKDSDEINRFSAGADHLINKDSDEINRFSAEADHLINK